jgi:hypothetical protein
MKLSELFDIRVGLPTTGLEIVNRPFAGAIPFLRPASTQERTIAGWIARKGLDPANIFPPETLFVSTNGEGSHTFAYVAPFEFACNSDVSVLFPKEPMPLPLKIYYARCISLNRFRFSYGRKPKGERLKGINLPPSTDWIASTADPKPYAIPPSLASADARKEQIGPHLVRLDELFEIKNGNGLELVNLERAGRATGIRFVSRAKRNNGVTAYVKQIKGLPPNPGGQLTCALSGEGGVLYTFLQEEPYYTSFHIACLTPKQAMTNEQLVFYCMCIRANRFRYSFGRQANRSLKTIRVPSGDAIPSWIEGGIERTRAAISIPTPPLQNASRALKVPA